MRLRATQRGGVGSTGAEAPSSHPPLPPPRLSCEATRVALAEAGRPLPWKSMAWGESRREGVPPRAAEMTCTYAAKLLLLSAEPSTLLLPRVRLRSRRPCQALLCHGHALDCADVVRLLFPPPALLGLRLFAAARLCRASCSGQVVWAFCSFVCVVHPATSAIDYLPERLTISRPT